MEEPVPSRRAFMAAIGSLASASWIAMNWADISAAAEPMGHDMAGMHDMKGPPAVLKTLTAAEAAEVDAVANQIVPGGANPGARDAHAVYFIDNALGSFFAGQLPAFRKGLVDFQCAFAATPGDGKPAIGAICSTSAATKAGGGKLFSQASDAEQIAFLHTVDKTPFFLAVRRLAVLGIIAMPKYGGNFEGLGSKLIGVVDRHVWTPPFGYYDRDYAGFTPYPGTKPYTA